MAPEELAKALAGIGRASIPYADPSNLDRLLVLECYRPATHAPHKPLVIVQHGQSRNGREYCDAWIPVADLAGFLVVAITFPKSAWPTRFSTTTVTCSRKTARFAREKPGR